MFAFNDGKDTLHHPMHKRRCEVDNITAGVNHNLVLFILYFLYYCWFYSIIKSNVSLAQSQDT